MGDNSTPIDPDRTPVTISNGESTISTDPREAFVADLYRHAQALAMTGDLDLARLAHDVAGKALEAIAKSPRASVIDLNSRRNKPKP